MHCTRQQQHCVTLFVATKPQLKCAPASERTLKSQDIPRSALEMMWINLTIVSTLFWRHWTLSTGERRQNGSKMANDGNGTGDGAIGTVRVSKRTNKWCKCSKCPLCLFFLLPKWTTILGTLLSCADNRFSSERCIFLQCKNFFTLRFWDQPDHFKNKLMLNI